MRQFAAALKNNKTLMSKIKVDDSTRQVVGEGVDKALFDFVAARQRIELVRFHNQVVFEQLFNSVRLFVCCSSLQGPLSLPIW